MNVMQIEFDPDKRDKTLAERGLDFAQAGDVFAGVKSTKRTPTFALKGQLKGHPL